MSDISPYFFMKEFSSEELINLLVNKIKELKAEKDKTDELNTKLQDNPCTTTRQAARGGRAKN